MKMAFPIALALSLAALYSVSAQSAGTTLNTSGSIIVDAQGKTVYTFDKDVANSGKSECNAGCDASWPPVIADAGAQPAGDLSIVTRADDGKQWAYKGKPLYYFAKDMNAGDKKGDKVRDLWHVVTP